MKTETATHHEPQKARPCTAMLKPAEHTQVEKLAKAEKRSKSSMARLLINEALEARETTPSAS